MADQKSAEVARQAATRDVMRDVVAPGSVFIRPFEKIADALKAVSEGHTRAGGPDKSILKKNGK